MQARRSCRSCRTRTNPVSTAPEQLLSGRVTLASDVYSLGLLLHDLLTGEAPAPTLGVDTKRHPLVAGQVRVPACCQAQHAAIACWQGAAMGEPAALPCLCRTVQLKWRNWWNDALSWPQTIAPPPPRW